MIESTRSLYTGYMVHKTAVSLVVVVVKAGKMSTTLSPMLLLLLLYACVR
jgi:hypothetical protein